MTPIDVLIVQIYDSSLYVGSNQQNADRKTMSTQTLFVPRYTVPPLGIEDTKSLVERLKETALRAYDKKCEQSIRVTPDERTEFLENIPSLTTELNEYVAERRRIAPLRIEVTLVNHDVIKVSILHI